MLDGHDLGGLRRRRHGEMRKRFDSNRIALVLPNPWRWPARLVALGFVAWSLLLFLGVESGFAVRGAALWITVAIVPMGLYALAYLRRDHKRRHGRLHADEDGLEFDAEPLVPRTHILAAHLITGRQDKVQISQLGRVAPIEIRVESLRDGRAIVDALGLEMSQGTAQYELPVPRARRWVPAAIIAAVLSLVAVIATSWALVAVALSMATAVALMRTRRMVAVGTDGVLMRYGFWSRFVELRDVVQVDHIERTTIGGALLNGVDLVLRSEEKVHLLAPSELTYAADDEASPVEPFGHQMKDRLGHLMGRIGSSTATVREAKVLRRQGRSAAAWFEDLRGIGSGSSAGYRAAPVAPGALWQLLEDPGADPSVRVAAAVALASSTAHHDPRRLGATAATVLAPTLRRALDRVRQAKGQADMVRALEAVTDDERSASRSDRRS